MEAVQALALVPGQIVTVPFGRSRDRRRATVLAVEDHGTWGRGMRPAGTTPDTPLAVVRVYLGTRVGERSFGNSLVELDLAEGQAEYVSAAWAAPAEVLDEYRTTTCPECGGDGAPEHHVFGPGGMVLIGCEGYFVVNPNKLGIDSPDWEGAWLGDPDVRSVCPTCFGVDGQHGLVHVRHGNGGGHNRQCPER